MLTIGGVMAQNTGNSELVSARRHLMPVPASIAWREGRLPVTKSFSVLFRGQTDERLRSYVFRILRRLEGRTVLELPREPAAESSSALLIETRSTGNAIPRLGDDESYTLEV